jgi:NAD(P)-dependent dehydrogenase (short-subunit alcohol dehydrogenase family)
MDLNSLDSIKDFTDRIRKKCNRIDILINNAGELFCSVKKLLNLINR